MQRTFNALFLPLKNHLELMDAGGTSTSTESFGKSLLNTRAFCPRSSHSQLHYQRYFTEPFVAGFNASCDGSTDNLGRT